MAINSESLDFSDLTIQAKALLLDGEEVMAGGLKQLSSGTITTTVAYVDVSLPTGYVKYLLVLNDFQTDDAPLVLSNNICFAFSEDAGVTFHNSNTNYNYMTNLAFCTTDSGAVTQQNYGGQDKVGTVLEVQTTGTGKNHIQMWISPGTATNNPFVQTISSAIYTDAFAIEDVTSTYKYSGNTFTSLMSWTNPQNYIRLALWTNGSIDPPASGEHFVAGSYVLYGVAL